MVSPVIDHYMKNDRDNTALALFAAPVVGLCAWYLVSRNSPARLALSCYILAATPFYLLNGSYPPFGSKWFWKSIIPVCVITALAVFGQIVVSGWFRYIEVELPARMAIGYTGCFAVLEGWLALRIVDATEPRV
jgi:hypothetical protein